MRVETNKKADKKNIFLVLILLALIIRIALLFYTQNNPLFYPDEKEYVSYAKNISEGKGFTYNGKPTSLRPPLYPFFLAGLRILSGSELILVTRIVQTLINLLTALLVYQIGKKVFNQRIARIGVIMFLFFPPLVGYNLILLSETVFIFFFVFAAYFFTGFLSSQRIKLLIFTGIIMGLAALTRDVTSYFVVLILIFLWFYLKMYWKKRLVYLIAFFLAFWMVIMPWAIRNTIVQGKFVMVSTLGSLVMYWSNKADTPLLNPTTIWQKQKINADIYYYDYAFQDTNAKTEVEKQQLAFKESIKFILHNPVLTIYRSLFRTMYFLGFERLVINQLLRGWYGSLSIGLILVVIAIIVSYYLFIAITSFYGMFFSESTAFKIFVIGWSVFNILMHALVYGHPRYHLAMIPFFCIYGAFATLSAKMVWQQRKSRKFFAATALGAILIAVWFINVFFIEGKFANLISHL